MKSAILVVLTSFLPKALTIKLIYTCNELNSLDYMGISAGTDPDRNLTKFLPKDKCRQCAVAQLNGNFGQPPQRMDGHPYVYPEFYVTTPAAPPGTINRRAVGHNDIADVSKGRCWYDIDSQQCAFEGVATGKWGVLITGPGNSEARCNYYTAVGHMFRTKTVRDFKIEAWAAMRQHIEFEDAANNHAGGHLYDSANPPHWWTCQNARMFRTNLGLGMFQISWQIGPATYYKTYFVDRTGLHTILGQGYDFRRAWNMKLIQKACTDAIELYFNSARARFPFENGADELLTMQVANGVPLFIYPSYPHPNPLVRPGGGSCFGNI